MVLELWTVGVAATAVMTLAYVGIAATLGRGLAEGRQWATNPLGVATALIFATCAGGHGMHVMHAALPVVGTDLALGSAARVVFGDPRLVVVNVAAAAIGVWYLSLRNRFKLLWRGSALFDDMRQRHDRALDIHDNVVQNLTQAKLALDAGEREHAIDLVDDTLEDSKHLITEILGEGRSGAELEIALESGEMRRPERGSGSKSASKQGEDS